MKLLKTVFKTLLVMAVVTFCSMIVGFFVAVFNPEGVQKAIDIVKSIT